MYKKKLGLYHVLMYGTYGDHISVRLPNMVILPIHCYGDFLSSFFIFLDFLGSIVAVLPGATQRA
jgi:hypothetical protein